MSITAADLEFMRADGATSLPLTAQILRNTPTSDGHGGQTDSWATLKTVACDINPDAQYAESVVGAALTSTNRYKIVFPALTDINEADRVSCGGYTYHIESQDNGIGDPVYVMCIGTRLV